ncbi:hypothetical protein [Demequina activiva]|uniref:Uncharacterized protein n=1 Tax=Demequina activiva TaxID=1582364 RepID=A0A919Q3J2_9MICO|nr:hypothetical protein [Demequina activiva]GIG55627.1 hypothetical protein Dac01nite_23790 [Demequina activiva]
MEFSQRHTLVGTAISIVAMLTYLTILVARAVTDGLPLAEVAWQGPMLWCVGLGGALYAVAFAVMRAQHRGQRVSDERTERIDVQAEFAASGITGLAVLAAIVMLALDVDAFWVANTLLIVSWLGSLAGAAVAIDAYRGGLDK